MMIYHTLEARCPRCQYTTTVRADAVDAYMNQCPSCGYPKFDEQPQYYLNANDAERMQRRLHEEWNV
jgi:ribosomal protein L37E